VNPVLDGSPKPFYAAKYSYCGEPSLRVFSHGSPRKCLSLRRFPACGELVNPIYTFFKKRERK
jgi:hypothetical protein